jgi:hypothetical protein
MLVVWARPAFAQTQAPWSGWVQCRFDVQGAGYSHLEVQTWTITGPPASQSNVEVYPATWSVTGTGMLRKGTDALTETAQWTVMVPATPAAFGVTTHLDRFTVQRWTKQIVVSGLTGQDVVTSTGAQPRVTNLRLSVDEQPFASIDVDLKSTSANGSSTPVVSGTVGPMRPRDAQGRGSCSWQFARGTTARLVPPPSSITTSSTATAKLAQPTASTTPTITSTTPATTSTTPTTTVTSIAPLIRIAPLPRTITLAGFTAAGPASAVAPRTITLTGFTAQGTAAAVAPRTIVLPGWTAAGP